MDGLMHDTMVDMKWTDVQANAEQGALVLLPLGVIEEHGPHLCLGTDIYTAHQYCLAMKELLTNQGHAVVIAPPFYWGVCQPTGGFVGSFLIRRETAKALLTDILASLAGFGFRNIFGVSAHGDIEHSLAIIDAFKQAVETLSVNARYAFPKARLSPFGLSGDEPYLCPYEDQQIRVSEAKSFDVHAGDTETAMINAYYPHLTDTRIARSLPPVELRPEDTEKWLFGGHIKELSPNGYIGEPGCYETVNIQANVDDYARRLSEAVLRSV